MIHERYELMMELPNKETRSATRMNQKNPAALASPRMQIEVEPINQARMDTIYNIVNTRAHEIQVEAHLAVGQSEFTGLCTTRMKISRDFKLRETQVTTNTV